MDTNEANMNIYTSEWRRYNNYVTKGKFAVTQHITLCSTRLINVLSFKNN